MRDFLGIALVAAIVLVFSACDPEPQWREDCETPCERSHQEQVNVCETKGIVTGALVGLVVAGPVGAVVGGAVNGGTECRAEMKTVCDKHGERVCKETQVHREWRERQDKGEGTDDRQGTG